jgi:energy-coupling factor transporter ATP-binding protein EcfA2
MKLKKLWVSKYKNLEDITFTFNDRLTTLLVGLNGFGKSNLLEAITIILRELDLAEKEVSLTEDPDELFFDFELEYSCKGNDVHIIAKNKSLVIKTRKSRSENPYAEIPFTVFRRNKDQSFFPDFVIGYYSGENRRVREFFKTHTDKRISILKSQRKNESVLGKLFFTEQNFGELIFFTLWVFKETPKYREKINELLQEFVKIEFESTVQLDICNPSFYRNFPKQNADNLFSNIQDEVKNPFWGITGDVDRLLHILYNNNLEKSMPISFIDESDETDPSKDINEFVQFPDLNFKALVKDFVGVFDTPVKFFDVLQAADSIGIIHKINARIVKRGAVINHDFRELSEGEQQLLTTIGLLLITGEFDSLLIYDEPDTHLNPQWQREYSRLIHRFILNDENSQILVATHSPLIVQSAEKANLLLFKAGEKGIVVDEDTHRIHNWRIDQVLQSEYFGLTSSRPPSLDYFMIKRQEIISKSKVTEEDIEALKRLDDSEGDLPTGETINDLKTMQLLTKLASKLSGND